MRHPFGDSHLLPPRPAEPQGELTFSAYI
jgi:hypothetical protein